MCSGPTGGQILFEGQDVVSLSGNGIKTLRRKIAAVFEDPYGSLNPGMNART
jgi:ABC-type microcin C transport system duplicated ATPase subunit YejF